MYAYLDKEVKHDIDKSIEMAPPSPNLCISGRIEETAQRRTSALVCAGKSMTSKIVLTSTSTATGPGRQDHFHALHRYYVNLTLDG